MKLNYLHEKLHNQALQTAKDFQKKEAELLDILQKIDQEKVYLILGYPSLFKYSVEALNLSEAQAYSFMTVARKSEEIPALKKEIESGGLTLSKARRIVPVIKKENQEEWIQKAKQLPKVELEKEVAKISPYAFKNKESVRILSEDKVGLRLEISEETYQMLKRAQTLLMTKKRRTLNFENSLKELLEDFLKKNDLARARFERDSKSKTPPSPRPTFKGGSRGKVQRNLIQRRLPAKLKREVQIRDNGTCTYKAPDGKTCGAEAFLQIHHIKPWGIGGGQGAENLQLICHKHHDFLHSRQSQK